jgi:microcystin-dependent protein
MKTKRTTEPATLLKYSITTEPFPLTVSPETGTAKTAKVTIVASNPDPEDPVTLKKISITLPIGDGGSDLSAVEPPTPIPPKYWKFVSKSLGAGKVIFRFAPEDGHQKIVDQGLDFVCNGIVMNKQPGTCTVEVEETNPTDENAESLHVGKFPHGWGEVYFNVDPANIEVGESTTLNWRGPEKAVYKIEYGNPETGKIVKIPKQGQDPLGPEGTYPGKGDPPLTLRATTTFTLHVSMSDGRYKADQQRTVTVLASPAFIEYFRPRGCTTSDCVIPSDEVVLEWQFQHVDDWQLSQDWPDFPHRPAQVIQLTWPTRSYLFRPTEKNTRYTLMVKDKFTTLTAVVNATLAQPVPVGTIIPYGALLANNLPSGWLYCNGAEYEKARYPQLYDAIKDVWGQSTATTVRIPDLRGYFVRGYDDRAGVDSGRVLGSRQADAFKKHTHGQKVTANENHGSAIRQDYTRDGSKFGEYEQGVQTYEAGENETRPKNVATYFVIYAGVYSAPPPRSKKKEESKGKKAAAKPGRAGTKGRRGGR